MLVDRIKEEGRKQKKSIFLVTSIHNQTADRFYAKNGFERRVGEIKSQGVTYRNAKEIL